MKQYIFIPCFLAVLALSAPTFAVEKKADFFYLKQWIGHTPNYDNKMKVSFWEDENIKNALTRTLGSDRYQSILTGWNSDNVAVAPIKLKDGVLQVFACQAHGCYLHMIRLFFDLKTGLIQACWRDGLGIKSTTDYWFGITGVMQRLPYLECANKENDELWKTYGSSWIEPKFSPLK